MIRIAIHSFLVKYIQSDISILIRPNKMVYNHIINRNEKDLKSLENKKNEPSE